MDLVTDPRLREMIELVTPLASKTQPPAEKTAPSDPTAREAWFASLAETRSQQFSQMVEMGMAGPDAPTFDGVEISEVQIPVTGSCSWSNCGPCAAESITAIVYRPVGSSSTPAFLHFHGGGWWVGGGVNLLRASGAVHAQRALSLGITVIDVDYRMSPEHKFPTPVGDCYAALSWVVSNAVALGIDAGRIAIGGGSAGGNLAAAVALMCRDRGGPEVRGQVLNIPVTDSGCNTPSMRLFADGYVMTRQNALDMWEMYLSTPVDAYDPYASPMHATDVGALPPALVILGDFDLLRDEGAAYAGRLVDAGVTVTIRRLAQTHGAALPENGPETERLTDEFLRSCFELR